MIGAVVQIIFAIILLGVIWWAVQQILPHIPMGEPFRTIVRVLMVVLMVVICLWVIWQLLAIAGIVSGGRPFRIGAAGIADRAACAVSASPARHLQGWG